MVVGDKAVRAAQKAYRECEGDSTESHRAALTAALPFLPVQGAVNADAIKRIERMAFGYEVMFENLCHISGTSGVDQSWYRAKAREATERLSPLHSITTESNKSVPGDCKRQYQDFMSRILSALEPSAARELALEEHLQAIEQQLAINLGYFHDENRFLLETLQAHITTRIVAIRSLSSPDHADAVHAQARDVLARFRDYVIEGITAGTIMRGGEHHNPIWQEVASVLHADSGKVEGMGGCRLIFPLQTTLGC
ncbi:hypothetical protein HED49_13095 [Ochrobactrum daejeonense]|nr:hypothetical protein [Brucella daejeonensis]